VAAVLALSYCFDDNIAVWMHIGKNQILSIGGLQSHCQIHTDLYCIARAASYSSLNETIYVSNESVLKHLLEISSYDIDVKCIPYLHFFNTHEKHWRSIITHSKKKKLFYKKYDINSPVYSKAHKYAVNWCANNRGKFLHDPDYK